MIRALRKVVRAVARTIDAVAGTIEAATETRDQREDRRERRAARRGQEAPSTHAPQPKPAEASAPDAASPDPSFDECTRALKDSLKGFDEMMKPFGGGPLPVHAPNPADGSPPVDIVLPVPPENTPEPELEETPPVQTKRGSWIGGAAARKIGRRKRDE